jgi:hypothetical protein
VPPSHAHGMRHTASEGLVWTDEASQDELVCHIIIFPKAWLIGSAVQELVELGLGPQCLLARSDLWNTNTAKNQKTSHPWVAVARGGKRGLDQDEERVPSSAKTEVTPMEFAPFRIS